MIPVVTLYIRTLSLEATGSNAIKPNGVCRSLREDLPIGEELCCGVESKQYQKSDFTCFHTLLPCSATKFRILLSNDFHTRILSKPLLSQLTGYHPTLHTRPDNLWPKRWRPSARTAKSRERMPAASVVL